MLRLHKPVPQAERSTVDRVDAEQIEADRRAYDVDDRIDRADFVKMDIVGRRAMDRRLGFGQSTEDAQRRLSNPLAQRRTLDEPANIGPGSRRLLIGLEHGHIDARAGDAVLLNRLGIDLVAGEIERLQRMTKLLKWQTGIDERTEHHIATGPRERIEVGDAGDSCAPSSLRALLGVGLLLLVFGAKLPQAAAISTPRE